MEGRSVVHYVQGVERRMVLVVIFFVFLKLNYFRFVVAMSD